ncbi:hypothetical protein KJ359_005259 [Pestalotiopsis sp. 9143b]|nr:hypothetical protein KJ359_005259 [Pestalotiopsis sp. 9143b]
MYGYRQTLSSPASSSVPGSSVTLSRPALCKAVSLLVLFWVLAAVSRFSIGGDDGVSEIFEQDSRKTIWRVLGPEDDSNDAAADQGAGSTQSPALEEEEEPSSTTPPAATPRRHTDRVAVTMENRPLANLIPVILHFHSVLGPEWPIVLYTTATTSANLTGTSSAFARAVDDARVEIRHLPASAKLDSHRAVSLFLADPWLWRDLAPFAKVLLFQADSILCANSAQKVDDFLGWDLVGAPIDAAFGRGYNGGLSLRHRARTLDIVTRHSFAADSEAEGAPGHFQFEDQWLYTRMAEGEGARLPPEDVARSFAVETVWQDRPLGFHQPSRWQRDRMPEIMEYCPEVGMISGAAFF